jgi:iron complex transport system substrate-binding protein
MPASRIVSLAPNITELVYAAGAGDRLVGAVDYSDYPPAALEIPRIGDAFRLDFERIRLLDPDLILAWRSGTSAQVLGRLESLGYRVVALETGTVDEIAAELVKLGSLAGTEADARRQAAALLAARDRLRSEFGGRPAVRVFFQLSGEPYFSISADHVISDVIELCGGANIFADLPGIALPVDTESVVMADPAAILAAVDPGDDAWKLPWREWQNVAAVRDESLFGIDRDLISRAGPRVIDAAAQVCEALDKARAAAERP